MLQDQLFEYVGAGLLGAGLGYFATRDEGSSSSNDAEVAPTNGATYFKPGAPGRPVTWNPQWGCFTDADGFACDQYGNRIQMRGNQYTPQYQQGGYTYPPQYNYPPQYQQGGYQYPPQQQMGGYQYPPQPQGGYPYPPQQQGGYPQAQSPVYVSNWTFCELVNHKGQYVRPDGSLVAPGERPYTTKDYNWYRDRLYKAGLPYPPDLLSLRGDPSPAPGRGKSIQFNAGGKSLTLQCGGGFLGVDHNGQRYGVGWGTPPSQQQNEGKKKKKKKKKNKTSDSVSPSPTQDEALVVEPEIE